MGRIGRSLGIGREARLGRAALVCWLAASSAAAQNPTPLLDAHGVTLSGSVRARVENWRWFSAPPAESEYTYGASVLRLRLSGESNRADWVAEGSFPLFLGLPQNAIAPAPAGPLGYGGDYFLFNQKRTIGAAALRQAFVVFKPGGRWKIRAGRFEFADGSESIPRDPDLAALKAERVNQRLIGVFNYALRSLDGADLSYERGGSNVRCLAARLTEGSFQLRALSEIDAELGYCAYTRALQGRRTSGEARLFVLGYQDRRGTVKVDNRPEAERELDRSPIRLGTPGAHLLLRSKIGPGAADLMLWGAAQFGQWGAQRHCAAEAAAEGGYRFGGRGTIGVRGGYFRSSGDGTPNDRQHHTFFQVLSSPRAYARFPHYVLMNVRDLFMQFRVTPVRRLVLRVELHSVRLTSAQDLWYDGGGAFQNQSFGFVGRPSGGRRSMGTAYDMNAEYVLTPHTSLSVYAGAVRGAAVPAAVFPTAGEKPPAALFSGEIVRRF